MVRARRTLIGMQILYVVFVPVWMFFVLVSAMWFDAPGSADVRWLVNLVYLAWAYPIGLIGATVAAWLLFARGRYGAAVGWNLVPLIWVAPILGLFLYVYLP